MFLVIMTTSSRRRASDGSTRPAKGVLLSAIPASEPSSVAHELASAGLFDVIVATSLAQACRLVASRQPEVIVVHPPSQADRAVTCARLRSALARRLSSSS